VCVRRCYCRCCCCQRNETSRRRAIRNVTIAATAPTTTTEDSTRQLQRRLYSRSPFGRRQRTTYAADGQKTLLRDLWREQTAVYVRTVRTYLRRQPVRCAATVSPTKHSFGTHWTRRCSSAPSGCPKPCHCRHGHQPPPSPLLLLPDADVDVDRRAIFAETVIICRYAARRETRK
jgi:hypothetical protein